MRKRHLQIIGINPARFDRSQVKFFLYLVPITVLMGLPIVFIFFNAFKPLDELLNYPPKFYTLRPTLQNFRNLMATSANKAIPMSRYLFNSTLTTLAVVFFTLMITTMAAYCMSKKNYRLKKSPVWHQRGGADVCLGGCGNPALYHHQQAWIGGQHLGAHRAYALHAGGVISG